jgi:hypothetical protein
MNNIEVMLIVQKWHSLVEDECEQKIDYEAFLKATYHEVLENM